MARKSPKPKRGRPVGPPTEPLHVRMPIDLMRRVRRRIGEGSLTQFVARALSRAVSDPPDRMTP